MSNYNITLVVDSFGHANVSDEAMPLAISNFCFDINWGANFKSKSRYDTIAIHTVTGQYKLAEQFIAITRNLYPYIRNRPRRYIFNRIRNTLITSVIQVFIKNNE